MGLWLGRMPGGRPFTGFENKNVTQSVLLDLTVKQTVTMDIYAKRAQNIVF